MCGRLIEGKLWLLGRLVLRGDKIVLVQQMRSRLLLTLRQLLRLDDPSLRLRERFMKRRGWLGLLPIRETIGTGVQTRSVLLSRGVQPLVIVQRWLGLRANCTRIVERRCPWDHSGVGG